MPNRFSPTRSLQRTTHGMLNFSTSECCWPSLSPSTRLVVLLTQEPVRFTETLQIVSDSSSVILFRRFTKSQTSQVGTNVAGTESFETHLLRMLHHVNMTIERNEIRLQEKEKREMSELEWKQVHTHK